MPAIPGVSALLSKIQSIHEKKNEDYTTEGKNYENFERAAIIASWFSDPIDKVFAIHIGTKLARLAALRSQGKKPNNESIDDTFLDLATYAVLWASNATYRALTSKGSDKNSGSSVSAHIA